MRTHRHLLRRCAGISGLAARAWRLGLPAALLSVLTACGGVPIVDDVLESGDGPPNVIRDISAIPDAVPRHEPRSRYGNPASYVVRGKRYYPLSASRGYVQTGIASWYGTKFHGRRTSSGEPYDMFAMTAAHRTLPLPTYVRVTNSRNGRSVIVRINDRGPFHDARLIDLSYAAAHKLGITGTGTGLVDVRAVDPSTPTQARAAEPRQSANSDDTGIYLQVGAFTERTNAEGLRSRLLAADIARIDISEAATPDATLYRVRIGPLPGVEVVDSLEPLLQRLGIDNPRVILD